MKIKYISDNLVQYSWEITTDEFEIFLKEAFNKTKNKIKIRGFRTGFVSRKICERYFGKKFLYKDAVEFLLQDKIKTILKTEKNKIIGQPELVEFELEKLDKNKPFHFGLQFILKPEIKLCEYVNIQLKTENKKILDDEIENEIQNEIDNFLIFLTKQNGFSLSLDNDFIIDLIGSFNNQIIFKKENISYNPKKGLNSLMTYLAPHLLGMKEQDKRQISVVFPDNYEKKEMAGKKIFFDVYLKEIRINQKLILTKKLISDLKIPMIQNIEDLKQNIKIQIQSQKQNQIKNTVIEEIFDYLIDNSVLEIPKQLIEAEIIVLKENLQNELDKQKLTLTQYYNKTNLDETKLNQKLNEQAIRKLKINFLLDEISIKENIQVTQEEIENFREEINSVLRISAKESKQKHTQTYIQNYLTQLKTVNLLLAKSSFNKDGKINVT
ncbi:trigger factor [Candidatus Phytoplasma melaleucae]|uniref:Trigger factor n=1 Tax=Candidatus Phytoplasma melaleucae TaxID=2982630 RepID=A0ABT9DDU9_9MOLU|nr:trigger factor ['Melaleuca sp.' phytoplasma]MDO8168200.1 trigger factor ['Melaleuca sp.' phytoplasma]